MKSSLLTFAKKHLAALLLLGGLGTYVLIAGTTQSCSACSAVTNAFGLPSFASTSHANPSDATPSPVPPAQAKVGDTLPDVQVWDEEGQPLSLLELAKQKPTVLVFYRGGWCPYCTTQLMALAEIESQILAAGYQIVALSPDQPSVIKATPDHDQLRYRLLSDHQVTAARALGLSFQVPADLVENYKNEYQIDIEAASGETHHLLPHPAVFLTDAQGVIRFAHIDSNYRVRLSSEALLSALQAN